MKADLEAAVAAAEKTADGRRANIRVLEAQKADAHSRIDRAGETRKKFARDAQLGNPDAKKEIDKARTDSASAAADLTDSDLALADEKLRLVEDEKAVASAKVALSRFIAEGLMRKRIEIAAQIDAWNAAGDRLHDEYAKLGAEIVNMDVLPRTMHGITSGYEDAMGARRLRACLSAWIGRLYPGAVVDEMKKEHLAISEPRFWSLPPEQDAKAA